MTMSKLKGPFNEHALVLSQFGCSEKNVLKLQEMWNEPHRYYHNQEHLEEILSLAEKSYTGNDPRMVDGKSNPRMGDLLHSYYMLIVAAFFHDAVYDPMSNLNEEKSATLMFKMCDSSADLDVIEKIILDTKDHTKPASSKLSEMFLEFDLHGLANGSVSRMIEDEKKIFKEYGFVDYSMYKMRRGEILESFIPYILKKNPDSKVREYIDWFKNRDVKIAVYPGTFFPFHRGHLDILQKAERVFDKVILAFGMNPAKPDERKPRFKYLEEMRANMPNHQIEIFEGMATEYVKSKNYPVSVVKGLRNPTDFDAERLQLRFMEDMDPSINIVYIISDRKYEHLSSSAIRMIQAIGEKEKPGESSPKWTKEYLVF